MDHQNMSEHVLCMVLYLIELGLDNQVQDDTVEEVRFLLNKRGLVSELSIYIWF